MSRRARVRLRVTDGFDEGTATVGPFRSFGAAPDIVVRAPRPAIGRADASTQLDATAYDDRGRQLRSAALRWKRGPRVVLGRGVGAALLPAGRLRLTVEARTTPVASPGWPSPCASRAPSRGSPA